VEYSRRGKIKNSGHKNAGQKMTDRKIHIVLSVIFCPALSSAEKASELLLESQQSGGVGTRGAARRQAAGERSHNCQH
jgi:hypothetical protein